MKKIFKPTTNSETNTTFVISFQSKKSGGIPGSGGDDTPQFSANLIDWEDGRAGPRILDPGDGFELVSVDYPFFLTSGRKARYSRLKIELINP